MRVELSNKTALERGLFHFLIGLSKGEPRAGRPLVASNETLRAMFNDPAPELAEAFRRRIDGFLSSVGPAPESRGKIEAPSSVLAVALAFHNCLCMLDSAPARIPRPIRSSSGKPEPREPRRPEGEALLSDPLAEFTSELIEALLEAKNPDECLARHAALKGVGPALRQATGKVADCLRKLIDRSPLTALRTLDVHTPPALESLASELLPGRETGEGNRDEKETRPRQSSQSWTDLACRMVARPDIGKWLVQGWVFLPETRTSCCNTGLVLEMLRRKGGFRNTILEFYESYDYFRAEKTPGPRPVRQWPVLAVVEKLLRFPGDSDAALAATRRGNEYFLKFRPFLEIVLEGNGIPTEYRRLTLEFFDQLRRLADYSAFGRRRGRGRPGDVSFESL